MNENLIKEIGDLNTLPAKRCVYLFYNDNMKVKHNIHKVLTF